MALTIVPDMSDDAANNSAANAEELNGAAERSPSDHVLSGADPLLRQTAALTDFALREPTAAEVRSLQTEAGYPLLSVFISTSPDMLIGPDHIIRIERLLDTARQRLALEVVEDEAEELVELLRLRTRRLIGQRTGHGIALFASRRTCKVYRVGTRIDDRVVVDPTFATRDLARSLALNPGYRLLLLNQESARLLVGAGHQLREVRDGAFPMTPQPAKVVSRGDLRSNTDSQRKGRHDDGAFVRQVCLALSTHSPSEGLPLVVVVSTSMTGAFKNQNMINPIGTLIGSHDRTPPVSLANLARPVIEGYLTEMRERAMTRLDHASRSRNAASGITHVWSAAQRRAIDTLLIDESFRYPAWTTLGGRTLVRAFTPESPDVIDDAVDEIFEMVQRDEQEVCFVPAGDLGPDRIAAVLKRQAS